MQLDNFRIAAGLMEGEFYGMVFQDAMWQNGWKVWRTRS